MSSETPWLIDELENADMLIIDGLHAWQFALDEAVQAALDAAEDRPVVWRRDRRLALR